MSPSIGPMRPSSRRIWRSRRSISARSHRARGHFEQLRGVERQRVGARRGHDRLSDPADPLGERPAASRVELREDVVEENERRRAPLLGDHLRLGEQEREHGQALLALGAEAPQVPLSRADGDVVEVRAEAGDAALQIALQPRLERRRGRRLAAVVERGARQAELVRAFGEDGREQRDRLLPGRDEGGAEGRHLLRPRRNRVAGRGAERDPPQRCVPLPDRGRILERERRAARQQPAQRPVEVRAARGGTPFHDGEPVGREDERRDLAAELLGRPQRRTVQLRALPGLLLQRHLQLDRPAAPVARRARSAPPRRRTGRAAGRRACAARSPACRRAATRAGSSCRRRSRP